MYGLMVMALAVLLAGPAYARNPCDRSDKECQQRYRQWQAEHPPQQPPSRPEH